MGSACSRKNDQSDLEIDDELCGRSGGSNRSFTLRWPVRRAQALESLAFRPHGAQTSPSLLEICVQNIVKVRNLKF